MGRKKTATARKASSEAPVVHSPEPPAAETASTTTSTHDAASDAVLHTFAGFTVLPISVMSPTVLTAVTMQSLHTHMSPAALELLQPERPETVHHLFMRKHSARTDTTTLPASRTLFLVNLPVDTNIMHLRRLFRRCGVVERVVWKGSLGLGSDGQVETVVVNETLVRRVHGWIHPTGSHAHVVFEDEESIERVLAMKPRRRLWSDEVDKDDYQLDPSGSDTDTQIGMNKWILQHVAMFPETDSLQSQVDQAMSLFENSEEQTKRELESQHNVPDADGFILVTRGHGRRNTTGAGGNGATVTAARAEEAKALKPKNLGLVDFYRFQKREGKRNELAELRRKFDEDKSKIATLKIRRRFRPY
ncbi:hypothetical protein BASA50_004735 [Batrachochytrium salamandrivorans]|uniref:RRM domain-containing protein n=1 Tax=Batrachochytrium salamandrivorans TaxID=1357716 RepID=A0ABQ8FHQ4_9FUNG|nr:hypothetical protein BASA62_009460 [Batrachochytrium salamandrivorans]KAH6563485.1 hypothetical protein BASA60_010695 [Batrachochytrium salamandrivorans]KAH6590749.1 hypothetical protein BASA61_005170 [Batrachochytrium salamandrivorans]KAH6596977.1 hypothetical protein BASA50_004735 [Batrachochytrium salamandrivorans]KAH9273480.1 hypothetical protein BASA83_004146 [Batrachochytrium salamandrivorans]